MLQIIAGGLLIGLLLPGTALIPVKDATNTDWNKDTFWYEPWGASGVHKGIDIFAPSGQPVLAATSGIVLYSGTLKVGGEVIAVLGPKWRVHYYAHLESRDSAVGFFVAQGAQLGTVGNSGNAAGKPSHLHYAVVTAIPYPWRVRPGTQGWKRMLYLDPGEQFQ
jgi:murein DD-endopeptidase MepM/ murein hydrolase activator NlpD